MSGMSRKPDVQYPVRLPPIDLTPLANAIRQRESAIIEAFTREVGADPAVHEHVVYSVTESKDDHGQPWTPDTLDHPRKLARTYRVHFFLPRRPDGTTEAEGVPVREAMVRWPHRKVGMMGELLP